MGVNLDPEQTAQYAEFVELVAEELAIVLRRDGHITPDEADETRAEIVDLLRSN